MCRIRKLGGVFREGRKVVQEEERCTGVHESFCNEGMVCAKKGDTVQRAPWEVIGDFSPEFPAEHRVYVVMRGVGKVGLRGHNCLVCLESVLGFWPIQSLLCRLLFSRRSALCSPRDRIEGTALSMQWWGKKLPSERLSRDFSAEPYRRSRPKIGRHLE